ncbi:MAG: F0F1 ATP synthase subunit A, partial [Sulfurimicrobium sp.]
MGKPEFFELLAFHLGPLTIGPTVLTTWLLMVLLAGFAWMGTRHLSVDAPSRRQTMLEGTMLALQQAIEDTAPGHAARLLPFIGTLWLFIAAANLMGLVPGLRSPTGDLSLTVALALLVFASVHWFGIRIDGWRTYLR